MEIPRVTNPLTHEIVVHVIANQDVQKCYSDALMFIDSKKPDPVTALYETNAIMVGASQFGQNMQGQVQMIASITLFWECSKEQAVSFRNQQKLMLKV